MTEETENRPTILAIAGHDPTGGAGIQADIETINSLGGHACSLITALTVQDSHNLYSSQPVEADLIWRQFSQMRQDFNFKAVKIGLISSPDLIPVLTEIISLLPEVPVIVDTILAAGGGSQVASEELIRQFKKNLLPQCYLATPNIPEAQKLSGKSSTDECAAKLMQLGCKNMLITGTHEDEKNVVNRLYLEKQGKITFESPRLPYTYHGSGCTISSAISFYLASNHSLTNAVRLAQDFTMKALETADKPGGGQHFPVRRQ